MKIKQAIGYYNENGHLEFVSLKEEAEWADKEFKMWFLEEKDETIEMGDVYDRGWGRRLITIVPILSQPALRISRGAADE